MRLPRLEHQTRAEEVPDLLTDDLVQVLPLVEHGREHEDLQRRIVGFADGGNCLEQLIHAEKGE